MLMFLKLPGCSVRLRGGGAGQEVAECVLSTSHELVSEAMLAWGFFTLQSAPALLSHGSASKPSLDTAARPLADLMKQYIAEEKCEGETEKSFFVATAYLAGVYDI